MTDTVASTATEPGSYFVSNYPPYARWNEAAVPRVLAAFESPQIGRAHV